MIVKKPLRRIKREFDDVGNEFCYVTDYVIWWLLGFIPLYIIVKDKYFTVNHGKSTHQGVYHWVK